MKPRPKDRVCAPQALLAIPFAFAFGPLVGDRRQGWALFAAMFALWIASVGFATGFDLDGNPRIDAGAPNMEGKEVRFRAACQPSDSSRSLWAEATPPAAYEGDER